MSVMHAGHIPPVLLRYIEGLETHDVEKVASTVSEDLTFIAATRTLGKAQFLGMLRALYSAFPDWRYDHDPIELHDGVYAVNWRQGGTHTGAWTLPGMPAIPATGRSVRIPRHHFFYRVRDGLIVEIRPDPVPGGAPRGILEQIGVTLPAL
jgi:predicted ester cyclase